MERYLITAHMHVLALILGVLVIPFAVNLVRHRWFKKPNLNLEETSKMRLDLAALIPVGVLLWNLMIFNMVYAFNPAHADAPVPATPLAALTFEKAIAAAGESTVALATVIIFCRLFGAIVTDAKK